MEDFRALRQQLEAQGFFRTNALFFILYLGHILLLEALPLVLLWHFGNGWMITILSAVLLATAQVRCHQHHVNHAHLFSTVLLYHCYHIGPLMGTSS